MEGHMAKMKMDLQGFTDVRDRKKGRPHIISAVDGQEKNGKTHLGLTMPGPIAIINSDTGLEGVVEKFENEKAIVKFDFDHRDANNYKQWEKMWVDVKKAYRNALRSKDIRSILCDTGTEMWELIRLARFGKLDQVMPHHYGPVNKEFRDLIREAYDSDKNVMFLHKMKQEYVNDKFTGKYERAGMKDMAYLVQVNMRTFWTEDGFAVKIIDCRQNAALKGEVITEPLNDFLTIAQMVYPNTEEGEWL
jgi:hypothetical protein